VISAQSAISRFRRDVTLGVLLKAALLGAAVATIMGPAVGIKIDASAVLLVLGAVWVVLSMRSVHGSRLAMGSPMLIAAGRFDAAEEQIDGALKAFSLSRKVKLLSLHHLAVLRHAQRRWQESALLCRALLNQRLGSAAGLMRATRLILADSQLELNDLIGAHDSLTQLHRDRMSLAESLQLMLVQLDYESRIGAWGHMMGGVTGKVEMAELMSGEAAARAQAFLALAAQKLGRLDWAAWLRRRVELLTDVKSLCESRPLLTELWP
jgi:hypothetical protein